MNPADVDLRVRLGRLELEHPLVDASGTFDLVETARPTTGASTSMSLIIFSNCSG